MKATAPPVAVMWRHAALSVIGTSHLRSGTACQDFSAIQVVDACARADAVIAVAADGAGSAARSEHGAREAGHTFLEWALLAVSRFCDAIEFLDDGFARRTLEDIRGRLDELAADSGEPLASFACTMLGAIVADNAAFFVQIGDGAIVYRMTGEADWRLALRPQRGEFANETVFVTRPDAERRLAIARVVGPLAEFAIMTDGVEHLAIKSSSGQPHAPFFENVFRGLRAASDPSEIEAHEEWLRTFLGSPPVCARTDDDKTLILCTRLPTR